MALIAYDVWTLFHFLSGILITYVLFPQDIFISFILANIGHFIIELSEKNIRPEDGKVIESDTNHAIDIIAFLLGSIICLILYLWLPARFLAVENTTLRLLLISLAGGAAIFETMREFFPRYEINSFLKGAYL